MTWMELFSTARDGRVVIELPIHVHPMSNNCWPYALWDFVSTTMIQFKLKCYYNFPIFFFLFLSCAVIPLPIFLFHCFHSLQFFIGLPSYPFSGFSISCMKIEQYAYIISNSRTDNLNIHIQHYYYILLKFFIYMMRSN